MKKCIRTMLSMILCLALLIGSGMPAQAADEDTSLGITFEAVLDNKT